MLSPPLAPPLYSVNMSQQRHIAVQKQIRVMENRLDKVLAARTAGLMTGLSVYSPSINELASLPGCAA